jgi:hypothetical protein
MMEMPAPLSLRKVVLRKRAPGSFRIFHTNFEVPSGVGGQVARFETVTENGDAVPMLLEEVLKVPGVETVAGRPYGIGVPKAFALAWGENRGASGVDSPVDVR